MDDLFGMGAGSLMWAAFVFNLFGFLARDELWLRVLMFIGSMLSIGYYSLIVADQPLWDAIFTRGTLMLANGIMIVVVISERTTLFMSDNDLDLYRSFPLLTPGQFRRIRRAATDRIAEEPETILLEGEAASRLYFVSEGTVLIEKAGVVADIRARVFLGEIAYLRGTPATATVTLAPGTRYLVWDHKDLRRLKRRNRELSVAMIAQFNEDLMNKVADSLPTDLEVPQLASTTA